MKTSILTNDVLTKGAILGGVMLASKIAEVAMICYGCDMKWMLFSLLEWLVVAGLFCYLLYRFTANYARLTMSERKEIPYFSYGDGWLYVVKISALAGIIASLGGHIFMHSIVGFDNYILAYTTIIQNIFSQAGQPVTPEVNQMLSDIQNAPVPTLIDSLLGGIWNYLFVGAIIGLIVAIFTRRKPVIFDKQNEQ